MRAALISNLEQWAADNFSNRPNGAVDHWKLEKFDLDIDHDGITKPQIEALASTDERVRSIQDAHNLVQAFQTQTLDWRLP
jgi:uncharacterized protein YijF (DUF1287 family)